jgi:RNA polymerase sigma factor (sigma-70 family)
MDGHLIAGTLQVPKTVDPAERLASLFDTHYDRLYRLARRLAANSDDALDLVQETFLRAARSPESIPADNASEEAWLVRVLINIRRDQWRRVGVRNRHTRGIEAADSDRTLQTPESLLISKNTIWSAMDSLPPRRRAIVVLHELDGTSIGDIASLLGISTITVRWHLSGGRRDLARILKHQLGGKQ